MDVYLIRHTKTATEPGLCYGQSDVPLAHDFADEWPKLVSKLPPELNEAPVFSSPLSRCRLLAERLSADVRVDPRLLELDFGDWEGRLFGDIETDQLRHWTEHFVDTAPPNGESFSDLHRRLSDFWQDLVRQSCAQAVVVTHAGAIRALLAEVLKLPLATAFQFRIDPASVHKLRHQNNYTYIDYLNL